MRSKRVILRDAAKLQQINPETLNILQKYKIDMSMRNLSERTQKHYIYDLERWFIFIYDRQQNKSIMELTDEDIMEFLYFCKTEGNNVERIKLMLATISAIYKFLRKKRMIRENPCEFIDRPKKGAAIIQQTYLTPEQVALMRERLITAENLQLRLYAMLSLSTMARVSAIAAIRWDMIDLEAKIIKGVLEKEGKIVDLYFSDEVKYLLVQLKLQRESKGTDDHGWLFYSGRNKDKPINAGTLGMWCKKIGEMINVPTLHPHDFRHSGATLLKNAGMALEDVSTLLNHESTNTTKRYYIKEDTARLSSIKRTYNI